MSYPLNPFQDTVSLKPIVYTLGYLGLVPFVGLSLLTGLEIKLFESQHFMLISYAAIILSFMGAIHWGTSMCINEKISVIMLVVSVMLALLAWAALLLPAMYSYQLLIVSFSVLCIVDHYLLPIQHYQRWYLNMRVALTTIVVLCLVVSAYLGSM